MHRNESRDQELRVLHIVPTLDVESGVASFAINHQRELVRYGIRFDYIYHFSNGKNYIEEASQLGSSVFKMPEFSVKNFNDIKMKAAGLINPASEFDIVHCGQANAAFLYAPFAHRCGIPFIQHSHSAGATSDSAIRDIRNRLLIAYADLFVSDRFACSNAAGHALFGRKKYFVALNGIDGEKYRFSQNDRCKIRNELGLTDKFILGCVGRMADQKNQEFLLPIFAQVKTACPEAILVFVGSGPNEKDVMRRANDLNLSGEILFLGSRNDVSSLYSAFDLLVMPSLYEGLPVAGIEAQFSGLNILFSDKITTEVSLLPDNEFLSLGRQEEWISSIIMRYADWLGQPCDRNIGTMCQDYDIRNTAKKLADAYRQIATRS